MGWFRRSNTSDAINSNDAQHESVSDNDDNSNKICVDCDRKKHQKEIPTHVNEDSKSSAAPGMPCADLYKQVNQCMIQNGGQISSCVKEWKFFKDCHAEHKETRK